ncbi:hypothetical protein [Sphaerotilus sp.]|uniref:hypothetical protein n=1 Tax=Sphaerotilus sp. TaxID=2093942 RepID=UPI0034E2F035
MNDLAPEDLLAALAGRYSVGPKQMDDPALLAVIGRLREDVDDLLTDWPGAAA